VKSNPGRISVATSGRGANEDVALQYFARHGYSMASVPYANPEQRYAAPFNRRAQALYEEPGDVAHLIARKQLRPLVLFDGKRHAAFPAVPTAKELGFDVPDLPNLRMLVVPAATPRERVDRLARAVEQVLDAPEWKKYCAQTYTCAGRYTPREATERMNEIFVTLQKYLRPAVTDR
jgi:tripartite-type tricarboxylate transporter receptor subunit TctC